MESRVDAFELTEARIVELSADMSRCSELIDSNKRLKHMGEILILLRDIKQGVDWLLDEERGDSI